MSYPPVPPWDRNRHWTAPAGIYMLGGHAAAIMQAKDLPPAYWEERKKFSVNAGAWQLTHPSGEFYHTYPPTSELYRHPGVFTASGDLKQHDVAIKGGTVWVIVDPMWLHMKHEPANPEWGEVSP